MSESRVTQILIFHPDCGERPLPRPRLTWAERTADRQRAINLELERVQVEELATVREIVLGTNNFVYAVVDYPATQPEEKAESKRPLGYLEMHHQAHMEKEKRERA